MLRITCRPFIPLYLKNLNINSHLVEEECHKMEWNIRKRNNKIVIAFDRLNYFIVLNYFLFTISIFVVKEINWWKWFKWCDGKFPFTKRLLQSLTQRWCHRGATLIDVLEMGLDWPHMHTAWSWIWMPSTVCCFHFPVTHMQRKSIFHLTLLLISHLFYRI